MMFTLPRNFQAITLAASAVLLALCPTAMAQPTPGPYDVAARVNDTVITYFDVEQRARLALIGDPGQNDLATLMGPALEQLISDTVKIAAARQAGIAATEELLSEGLNEIAAQNGVEGDQLKAFLLSKGVSEAAIDGQVEAEIVWRELIRQRFGSRVSVSESDIDTAIASGAARKLGTKTTPDTYRMKQIVVGLAPDASDAVAAAAQSEAASVRSKITSCGDIDSLKAGYSTLSGDVGTLTLEEMPAPVAAKISKLDTGDITQPIRSNDGFHVIMVCEKIAGKSSQQADRDLVRKALIGQRLDRFSRSLLQEMRRKAAVERF